MPSEFLEEYESIFPPVQLGSLDHHRTHAISSVRLVLLRELFVRALSRDAYEFAKSHPHALEGWFCSEDKILCQGSSRSLRSSELQLSSSSDSRESLLNYQILMTEPVLQGYASRTETTFVVLPPTERTPIVTINGTEPSPSYVPVQEDSEDEDLEIHEDFLSNTLSSHPIDAALHAVSNGSADSLSPHAPGNEFAAEQLSNIIDPTSDDCTVYIRTADLSKVGILDGDWVRGYMRCLYTAFNATRSQAIASSASSSFSRLVRVRADDKLVMKQ